jgi:glycosyltransferase involved in cell wall biosynthesis
LEARLNKGSKLWVVVPETEAALIAREGVVVFIDPNATEFDSLLAPAGNSGVLGITLRAALLVDPVDDHKIVQALRGMLDQPSLQEQCRRQGLIRAAQFSWTKTAVTTRSLLERLA